MKFAFSTVCGPTWDIETTLGRARSLGYDGVELHGPLDDSQASIGNVFLTAPAKLRDEFPATGIELACLSSEIAFTGNARTDAAQADHLKRYLDTAAAVGSARVKVRDVQTHAGVSKLSAAVAMGDWLLPLGDYAADREVTIVIENTITLRRAREMWAVLDRLAHPAIACSWNVLSAALAGESPWVSVPVLNSKIAYARIADAKITPAGAAYCPLGDGDVPGAQFITRLRGIGYGGYVTVNQPSEVADEADLSNAIAKLNAWMQLGVEVAKPARK
jgi:sugar phosphate isomerase/epimerase